MAKQSVLPFFFSPAAIAIHDYGYMLWQFLNIYAFF
jgi:hypothetical protein